MTVDVVFAYSDTTVTGDACNREPGVAAELGSDRPLFHYPLDVRKAIYTNSVDSRNPSLRKIIKPRGFPDEDHR